MKRINEVDPKGAWINGETRVSRSTPRYAAVRMTSRSSWSPLGFQNDCDYMFRINTRSPLNEGLQRYPFGRLGIKMDSSLLNCADSPPGKNGK